MNVFQVTSGGFSAGAVNRRHVYRDRLSYFAGMTCTTRKPRRLSSRRKAEKRREFDLLNEAALTRKSLHTTAIILPSTSQVAVTSPSQPVREKVAGDTDASTQT